MKRQQLSDPVTEAPSPPPRTQKPNTGDPVGQRETHRQLLDAAKACLCQDGYARLSTRRVAELAGVPLSQIHYHFKSKRGLVLALLEDQNQQLLARQAELQRET